MEHTKEPWQVRGSTLDLELEKCYLYHPNIGYLGVMYGLSETAAANARRIVACVNKLAGWSIEQLEDEFLLTRPVNSCDVSIADGGELLI